MNSIPMHAMSNTAAFPDLGGAHHAHHNTPYPLFPMPAAKAQAGTVRSAQGALSDSPSSAGFVAMLAAYRASGGTARGDDLARLLQDRQHGGYVSLARLIATRKVFSFEWRNTYWVPMFQFDLSDLSLRPGPQQVMAELNTEFDDWRLAMWFTQPNAWLHDDKPVDLLHTQLQFVIEAARADRFIAAG